MIDRAFIIVNPRSGAARAEQAAAHLVSELCAHHPAKIIHTKYPNHAREIARNISDVCDVLIVIGGDGTVNEVVNGLMESAQQARTLPPIGIIPVGTGNTLAYELGIPKNVNKALAIIKGGRLRCIDLGEMRLQGPFLMPYYFCCMAGVGFDAEVVRAYTTARRRKSHAYHYVIPTLATIKKFSLPRIYVTIDGKEIHRVVSSVVVCNTKSYGIRMSVIQDARPDDGLLNASLFTAQTRMDMVRIIVNVLLHRPLDQDEALYLTGRQIHLHSDSPVAVQLDGDFVGYLPAEIQVRPQAIRFFVP